MLLHVAEGKTHSGAGGRDVLEGSGGRKPCCLLEFPDELPGVERVQEVDVSGLSAEHLDGQIGSVLHEDPGRLLIGVAAILEFEFVHFNPPDVY